MYDEAEKYVDKYSREYFMQMAMAKKVAERKQKEKARKLAVAKLRLKK